MSKPGPAVRLSAADARYIDRTCDRFEAAWRAGGRPDPQDYLGPADEPVRSTLLRHLLLLDGDYRRQRRDDPNPRDYADQFPRDRAVIEDVQRELSAARIGTRFRADASDAGDTPWSTVRSDRADLAPDGSEPGPDRYDLTRELGHGGIGLVFHGWDRRLGRGLAVKVLREPYRDQASARRRFIAEARIGSRLQHPSIVPVYEQGWFPDGSPFFTMKLVEGHTLAALLRDRPDPGHDLSRMLAVFGRVCEAMAYAHARGVIHRDLKPANVMVGAFGEVQVMDWGFAKILITGTGPLDTDPHEAGDGPPVREGSDDDPHGGTAGGALMGTPAYMPPEQARGDIALVDPRADVFALGAMLCEILTGRPPYSGESSEDVVRNAANANLAEAYTRLDACGADQDVRDLARRCLAAERTDRPADAGVVAREIEAYQVSVAERLRQAQVERAGAEARVREAAAKSRAERRARLALLGLAAALLIGTAAASVLAWMAIRAHRDAVAAAGTEAAAKREAETRQAEAQAVLKFVKTHILAAARPVGRPGGLGYDVTLRQALVAARAAVETEFADQPLVQAELHHTLGICFGDLGDADLAAEHMRNALTLRTARLGPEDPLTLTTATDYAVHLNFTGKHADALRLLEETLPACQRVLGTDNLDTLGCAINLAMTYDRTGRHDRAIERLEQSLDLATAKYGPRHPIVFKTMINLANSYDWAGRKSEALTFRERMAPLVESLNPDDADVLMSRHNLAYSYRQLKRYADALPIDRDTFDRRQKVFGPFHPNTLTSLWCVCADLVELGRGSEAIPLLDDSLERAVGQSLPGKIRPLADLRIEYCERHHDAAGCRRTAELWEVLNRTDGDSLYHAAVYRAVTAKVLQATDPSASGQVAAEVEAEKAVAWLRKLKATGPFDTKQIKTDPNFQPLLSRTDFEDIIGR